MGANTPVNKLCSCGSTVANSRTSVGNKSVKIALLNGNCYGSPVSHVVGIRYLALAFFGGKESLIVA